MIPYDRLRAVAASHPYPLLFATISGAHLYGFPSPDSDFDLRGVHLLGASELLGLDVGSQTIEMSEMREGLEIDLVTHEARKFFTLLLKPNGYVLEQLYSPLVVHSTAELGELRAIARACITRRHAHHYLGFSRTQLALFKKDRGLKPLLYLYRVLLTGIHLMQTGEVEANLNRLNDEYRLPWIPDLVHQKTTGAERTVLDDVDIDFHEREVVRLTAVLEETRDSSSLPDMPSGRPHLNDLLLRLRGVDRLSRTG